VIKPDSETPPLPSRRAAPAVPDFEMLRPIGHGGFGEVWLATNRATGRLCAVKLIPLEHVGSADFAAREVTSLARLEACRARQHPNLLTIYHVGKTADYLFSVMDPADDVGGGPASTHADYRPATLQSRLQVGLLPPELCRTYAGQLLGGLASLHAAGMVHRDVKPSNCLIVDGQLKLADFGLVTAAHALVSRVGTQQYMPPDGPMDQRADVYAAGLVIYEMLSGLPASEFPRLGGRTAAVRSDPRLAALLRIVLRACERDPQLRPADAPQMLAELESDLPPETGRRPGLVLAGWIGAALLVAGGWIAWSGSTARQTLCEVSFATEPFEAWIYLDGVVQRDAEGTAYTTPCTVPGLPARACKVEFEFADSPQLWDAGTYDFRRIQQIVVRRP